MSTENLTKYFNKEQPYYNLVHKEFIYKVQVFSPLRNGYYKCIFIKLKNKLKDGESISVVQASEHRKNIFIFSEKNESLSQSILNLII